MNMTLGVFYQRVDRIGADLDNAEILLNISNAFDGTINMTDVVALGARLRQLNATAFSLGNEANGSISQLQADQLLVQESCSNISSLNESAQVLLLRYEETTANATSALRFVRTLNRTFMNLRRNLTRLDMMARQIEERVSMVVLRTANATLRLDNLNSSLVEAYGELYRREAELEELGNLVRMYNATVASLEMASGNALGTVEQLQV